MRLSGIERIAAERQRQVEREGWTPKHDDKHDSDELSLAAIAYASPLPVKVEAYIIPPCGCRSAGECHHVFGKKKWIDPWPWESEWDKRKQHPRLRRLEIAGALIAAEIDRLLRSVEPEEAPEQAEVFAEKKELEIGALGNEG
jgi:hypothetical protein